MYDLAPYSCRKFYIICPDCGRPSEYKIAVHKLQSKEYRCICHDSISFCEKFISRTFLYALEQKAGYSYLELI